MIFWSSWAGHPVKANSQTPRQPPKDNNRAVHRFSDGQQQLNAAGAGRALPAPAARPADQLRGPEKEEPARPPKKETQEQKKAGPAPFTLYDAAALLRAAGLKAGEGWADSAKRLQAGSKGQEAGRIMSKLWEAMEEGLLSEAERMTVRELVAEYDAATMKRK
jgi:hypothetical protein